MASDLEGTVDVAGEVLEADVRQRRFQLWIDDRNHVSVTFSESQEGRVTSALKDHKTVRMKVRGRGELSPQGALLGVTEVETLEIQPTVEAAFNQNDRPIEDVLEDLASEVPQSDWERFPRDLTDNLDHYLYGTPKR